MEGASVQLQRSPWAFFLLPTQGLMLWVTLRFPGTRLGPRDCKLQGWRQSFPTGMDTTAVEVLQDIPLTSL